jgi:hypothetical protein
LANRYLQEYYRTISRYKQVDLLRLEKWCDILLPMESDSSWHIKNIFENFQ